MKRILVILVALAVAATADAQTKVGTGKKPVRTRVIVAAPIYPAWGFGFGPRFSAFYDPFYSPYYDPFYRNRVIRQEVVPDELQLDLEKVDNEFDFKIDQVRDDKSLAGKERRQKIRELRYQKENALIEAKKAYLNRKSTKE